MDLLTLPLNGLSLREVLQQAILTALPSLKQRGWTPSSIPLSRYSHPQAIVYRCAAAFPLARWHQSPPRAVALRLKAALSALRFSGSQGAAIAFAVEVREQGWLDFSLREGTLAVWLERLPQEWDRLPLSRHLPAPPRVGDWFPVQYAHARCCSLLRLGHRLGLVQLRDPALNDPTWQWLAPHPIPWRHSDSGAAPLRLVHPRERQLLHQLLDVAEQWQQADADRGFKLACRFSQAVLEVDRHCRIFGEIARENPQLAQARLGLVAVSQSALRALLEAKAGVPAPTAL